MHFDLVMLSFTHASCRICIALSPSDGRTIHDTIPRLDYTRSSPHSGYRNKHTWDPMASKTRVIASMRAIFAQNLNRLRWKLVGESDLISFGKRLEDRSMRTVSTQAFRKRLLEIGRFEYLPDESPLTLSRLTAWILASVFTELPATWNLSSLKLADLGSFSASGIIYLCLVWVLYERKNDHVPWPEHKRWRDKQGGKMIV